MLSRFWRSNWRKFSTWIKVECCGLKIVVEGRRSTMLKAAYYEGSRNVRIGECLSEAPGPDQVQLNVSYCGICGTDLHLFRGNMDHRVHIPQVFGHEVSGTIQAVGDGAKKFKPADHAPVCPLDPYGAA